MKRLKRLHLGAATKLTFTCLVLLQFVFVSPVQAGTVREAGISTGVTLLRMNNTQLDYRMRDMQALGAKWIRVDFDWSVIQPNNYHDFNWALYDRVTRVAQKHNLKILATLTYTPAWARNARCAQLTHSKKCSPRNTIEFARFARASVVRYRGAGVHTWEIWNEPNLTGHWKTVGPGKSIIVDPEAYARTANTAAREIRHHDSAAFIITGGLAPMFEPKSSSGMRQSDYLAQLLPNLEPHLFDGVGVHPYSWPKMPDLVAEYNAFYTVDKGKPKYNLRTIMARAGWGDKQIWATEFGASTKGVRAEGVSLSVNPVRPDHVSEDKQAQIVEQGLDDWYNKPDVGPIFMHADSDQWLPKKKNEGGFGLRRNDGSKKPAYAAFQEGVEQL